MTTNNPFYPDLSEQGQQEAMKVIETFKAELKKAAEEVIDKLYYNIPDFIESDSWGNYRNSIMQGMCDYGNKEKYRYDYKRIRAEMYKQFKTEIDADIQQDIIEENIELKKSIEFLKNELHNRRY